MCGVGGGGGGDEEVVGLRAGGVAHDDQAHQARGQARYQSTSRCHTRRATVVPRSSMSTSTQSVAAAASSGGVGNRSPLVRGRPRLPVRGGAGW